MRRAALALAAALSVAAAPAPPPSSSVLPDPLAAGWHGRKVCELVADRPEMRVLRCTFPPGVGHERHYHPPHWGYILAGSTMRITSASGTVVRELKAGETWWSDGIDWHEGVNVGQTTGQYLIVEPRTPAAPAPFQLIPGHIALDRGPDGNTVVLDAPTGLIVVDSGRHPEHATAILEAARARGKPVAALVNSHWHLDHTTGNREILAAYPGAQLMASGAAAGALDGFLARSAKAARAQLADPKLDAAARARTTRALAAIEDRAALVPAQPIGGDAVLNLGGRPVEVHLARNAATEGDLWLRLPDERLVVAGDLVVAPVPFFDTACAEGWSRALEAINAASWDRLVPGHGAVMDRAGFARWRLAFARYVDCAGSARPVAECATGWMADAAGFYTPAEAESVRLLAYYYVESVLRAPAERRMAYCRKG